MEIRDLSESGKLCVHLFWWTGVVTRYSRWTIIIATIVAIRLVIIVVVIGDSLVIVINYYVWLSGHNGP